MAVTLIEDKIDRPDLDVREYRLIKLQNDLEALLVHDPDTDKASAALDVRVGHLSDPAEAAGLAHFCEHLLFMGTEKYPKENDYSEFLSAHNGSSNAYTATVDTNYFFDVGQEFLEPALDRFSQFFISPLFLESCKDREILAVDSENKKNLQNDMWRAYQLEKSLSNPEHVYSKFGTGSLETLKIEPEKQGKDVREELLKFHQNYYSANQMRLVLLGRESLDQLEALTIEKFSGIANKEIQSPYFEGEVLRKGIELGTVYTFKPIKEVRNLELCFPIPDCDSLWQSQPSHYISHLIGHEGEGSILSYLKAQGWVLYLGAGGSSATPGTDFFKINMELTQTGCHNWPQIIQAIFAYIQILKVEGVQQWIFDELKLTGEAQFRYKERSPASRFTSSTAGKLHLPIDKRYILGTTIPRNFRPEEIRLVLDALRYDNFRVALADPELTGVTAQEKYYGTEYNLERISDELLQTCSPAGLSTIPELHLPLKNDFIPENFTIEKEQQSARVTKPSLIKTSKLSRVWHKKDDTFWVPKVNYLFLIRNPKLQESAERAVMTKLFIELLKDNLNEYAYNADIAGLQYAIEPSIGSFTMTFSGYNDKMNVLVEKVMRKMKSLPLSQDRYNIEKDRIERELRNFDYESPYQQVSYHMAYICTETSWSKDEQVEALSNVTYESIQQFSASIFDHFHIEILAHGNLNKAEALETSTMVEDILSGQDNEENSEAKSPRTVILLKTKSIPTDPYEAAFEQKGFRPIFVPVLDHKMVNLEELKTACEAASVTYSGLIVTSQRSVEAVGIILPQLAEDARKSLLSMPVYTVGPATCQAIQNLGFQQVLGSEAGNGDSLATYILNNRDDGETRPLFFAVGDKRRDIISRRMSTAHVSLKELIVYETVTASTFVEDFRKATSSSSLIEWIVFFSPAGADVALEYLSTKQSATKIATIGPTTKDYLVEEWQVVPAVVSSKPDPESLIATLSTESACIHTGLSIDETIARSALWLPVGSNTTSRKLIDPANTNSCIEYLIQIGDTSNAKLRALGSLFAQLCSEPAFNQLRTKEQLGYIVFSGCKVTLTANAFRILIQSEKNSAFLASRIENFLDYLREHLSCMTTETFATQKLSLISKLSESLKNLTQETKRYWAQITSSRYNFEDTEEQIELIKAITISDIKTFFETYVHQDSKSRRQFSMTMDAQVPSTDSPTRAVDTERICDLKSFKSLCSVMDRPIFDISKIA